MIKMKALHSFGVHGANEGKVRRGREFETASDARANDLERMGHAHRVEVRADIVPFNKVQAPAAKAAEAGPLGSVGGMTGEHNPLSSSDLVHPQPKRRGRPPSTYLKDVSDS